MTREEAISWLVAITEHEGEDVPIYDEDVEAINMAIKALEQEPTTKNNLGVDCISRADAIKAMEDKAKKLTNEDTINGLCGAVAILYELPPVTPQEPILDEIRAEIEQTTSRYCISRERGGSGQVEWSDRLIKESEVLEIIDKYKAENNS